MKPESLRAEFVLSGAASIAAVVGLLTALRQIDWAAIDRFLKQLNGGTAALALVAFIAASYLVGIVMVQATFRYLTLPMIESLRTSRWKEMCDLDQHLRDKNEVPPTTRNELLLAHCFEVTEPTSESTRHFRSAAFSYARASASPELAEEYSYRRANRQVFVGVMPAVAVATVAGSIELFRIELWWWAAMTIVVGAVLLRFCYLAAKYQEQIAQSLLLDSLFVERWATQTERKML